MIIRDDGKSLSAEPNPALNGVTAKINRTPKGNISRKTTKFHLSQYDLEILRASDPGPGERTAPPFQGYKTIPPKCPGCKNDDHDSHRPQFRNRNGIQTKCRCFICGGGK